MENKTFTTETQRHRDGKTRNAERGTRNARFIVRRLSFIVSFSLCLCVSVVISFVETRAQVVVKGETVWTMAGEPITNGVVLINNGKIEAVGTAAQVRIPSNYRVISAKVVTPGLIDAHTVIGLNGYLNQPHEQMGVDASSPVQPELRAIDSYNTEEKLIQWVRSLGVTIDTLTPEMIEYMSSWETGT